MTTRLAQVGVNHNRLPMLAENAMKPRRRLVNNRRKTAGEVALDVYARAL
jgi:alcohol dehydrogenase class IV